MKKTDERCKRLFKLGFKYNGEELFLDDMNIHWTEITCLEDEEFEEIIKKFEKRIAETVK